MGIPGTLLRQAVRYALRGDWEGAWFALRVLWHWYRVG